MIYREQNGTDKVLGNIAWTLIILLISIDKLLTKNIFLIKIIKI